MSAIWIVVGVAIAGALAKRIVSAHNRGSEADLGFVSNRWIAEHRLAYMSDAQR